MAIYVDINRCIGCRSCEVACQRVHGGHGHINVHYVGDYAAVPVSCHHCQEAGCTMACFSGALHKEEDRTVFDVEKCTGCGLCALACPFGVVWTDKIAHKCDLCRDREGGPACIATCSANALSDDFDLAARRARERAVRSAAQGGRR